jgi:outer membrane protein TolC
MEAKQAPPPRQQVGGEATPQPAGDLSRWWETLGDETLTGLVQQALVANPDLRAAQSRLRQARAQRGLARIDWFPSVDGTVTAGTSQTTGTPDDGDERARIVLGRPRRELGGGHRRSVQQRSGGLTVPHGRRPFVGPRVDAGLDLGLLRPRVHLASCDCVERRPGPV